MSVDNFENMFRDRLYNAEMPPSPKVWEQVEAALPPEKKRRGFAWWMYSLGLLVLASGIGVAYLLTFPKQNPQTKANANSSQYFDSKSQAQSSKQGAISKDEKQISANSASREIPAIQKGANKETAKELAIIPNKQQNKVSSGLNQEPNQGKENPLVSLSQREKFTPSPAPTPSNIHFTESHSPTPADLSSPTIVAQQNIEISPLQIQEEIWREGILGLAEAPKKGENNSVQVSLPSKGKFAPKISWNATLISGMEQNIKLGTTNYQNQSIYDTNADFTVFVCDTCGVYAITLLPTNSTQTLATHIKSSPFVYGMSVGADYQWSRHLSTEAQLRLSAKSETHHADISLSNLSGTVPDLTDLPLIKLERFYAEFPIRLNYHQSTLRGEWIWGLGAMWRMEVLKKAKVIEGNIASLESLPFTSRVDLADAIAHKSQTLLEARCSYLFPLSSRVGLVSTLRYNYGLTPLFTFPNARPTQGLHFELGVKF